MKSGSFVKKITTPTTTDNSLSPSINGTKIQILFNIKGSCLNQKNATFTPPNVITFFIVYELHTQPGDLSFNFTLKDCSFGGIKLAKNDDPNKYVYSGYGIGFSLRSELSLPDSSVGKNVIIFGVAMSSSKHIGYREKDISILGIGLTQGLDHTWLTVEAQYSINFSRSNRKFCLSLHHNESKIFIIMEAKHYQTVHPPTLTLTYPLSPLPTFTQSRYFPTHSHLPKIVHAYSK